MAATKPHQNLREAKPETSRPSLRLRVTAAVESALRGIARKIHASRKADPGALIDPDAEEVQQLKSAAMPLLFQLREDQKREVRTLARIIGLEKVASMI